MAKNKIGTRPLCPRYPAVSYSGGNSAFANLIPHVGGKAGGDSMTIKVETFLWVP